MNFFNREPKERSLPSTRKEQFLYLHRYYFNILSFLSYFTFLYFLPFIGYFIFFQYQIAYLTKEGDTSALLSFITYYSSIFIPLVMLPIIGLSGSFYVTNRMTLDLPTSVKDYFHGIKENIIRSLLPAFLLSLSFYLLYLDLAYSIYYTDMIKGLRILLNIVAILQFIFCSNFSFLFMTQNVRYNLKMKDLIKNSFLLSFSKFYLSSFILLLAYLPLIIYLFLIVFTMNHVVIVIGFVLLFLLYFSYFTLLLQEYHQYLYDEIIHKTNITNEYRRGLQKED